MRNSKLEGLGPRATLIERAYQAILDAICEGHLPPGERLNQDELAARLQISRQPVGQALMILKTQGFVRDNGRRGLIVTPIERDFFRSVYQLRGALDSMAAGLAAVRRSAAELAEGRKLIADGRAAVAAGALEAVIAADLNFHMWTYRAAGNSLLVDTMTLYWAHLRRAMGEILRRPGGREEIWDEHEAILDAIVEQNTELAEQLSRAHAREASERVAESVPNSGPTESSVSPRRRSLGRTDTPLAAMIAGRKSGG
jgi:DNA-binding GntR family transcriptional regulator